MKYVTDPLSRISITAIEASITRSNGKQIDVQAQRIVASGQDSDGDTFIDRQYYLSVRDFDWSDANPSWSPCSGIDGISGSTIAKAIITGQPVPVSCTP
jgi:hypothetical protein